MKNYPTITVEFEVCNCCGHVDDSEVPDTEFNRQQVGDKYFEDWLIDPL